MRFLLAILLIALVWFAFFRQQTYQGQTAEQWASLFNATSNEYDTLQNKHKSLLDCLTNVYRIGSVLDPNYSDYVSRTDVANCAAKYY